ncbi:hypothetical protein EKN56_03085 [Limnobaculum zhutongyuii]|uniref:Uncharacterized protein n=1 Tax=Limnobaculum zhutongyuii TaxID=2498113 RepID=A0A411WGU0_9GAMM|nr:hypothetical protein [Limnobaculum zhutongyuii]QBH95478.1 hypothetical protein EKN56_03085 [Limnobaculum zhutongyuii]TQS88833.1 hypothetical protein ELQ32_09510 [Limnobaculum zhutongyuii]
MNSILAFVMNHKTIFIKLTISVLLFGVGWAAGTKVSAIAHNMTLNDLQAKHAKAELQWESERKAAAERQIRALDAAVQKQQNATTESQRITTQLLETQQQLSKTERELKKRINDATKNDGRNFNGIGPYSLQLYRAALGYPIDSRCLPANTSGAAGSASETTCPGAGLSPEDILDHITDYGTYCRTIEKQLISIKNWERNK